MTAKPRVFFVDDEPNLLNGLRRQLRRDFDVVTAVGAAKGLFELGREGPFEVIVSDFLMPGINGAEFLAQVRKAAPDATRMLLTGHTNLADAATTVNEGGIYRMLLKPVDQETMTAALRDCVTQHRRVAGERELLEQTLHGSVTALMEVLALANPGAFDKASRMRRTASAVLDRLDVPERWSLELAVLMSQLGAVSLPPPVVAKLAAGAELTPAEQRMVNEAPEVAERLIAPIPRLTAVTEAIRFSGRGWNGGDAIPFGARLLHLVRDHDDLVSAGALPGVACLTMQERTGRYDPQLLSALTEAVREQESAHVTSVALADLEVGAVIASAVRSRAGTLLVNPGQEVTVGLLSRLRNFAAMEDGVAEPLIIRVPAAEVSAAVGSLASGR